jgi:hypothetical protein
MRECCLRAHCISRTHSKSRRSAVFAFRMTLIANSVYSYADFCRLDDSLYTLELGARIQLDEAMCARVVCARHHPPDVSFANRRHYGPCFEVLVTLTLCASFTFLVAGNFVGMARVLSFVFPGMQTVAAVLVTAILTGPYVCVGARSAIHNIHASVCNESKCLYYTKCPLNRRCAVCSECRVNCVNARSPVTLCALNAASYAIGGGLLSVVYTDVVMSVTGIIGLALCAIGIIASTNTFTAPPSTGFPG